MLIKINLHSLIVKRLLTHRIKIVGIISITGTRPTIFTS